MKINERIIITPAVYEDVTIPAEYDENGELMVEGRTERRLVTPAVTEARTRDMTPEEEAELLAQSAEIPAPALSAEDRIAELESAIRALLGGDTE